MENLCISIVCIPVDAKQSRDTRSIQSSMTSIVTWTLEITLEKLSMSFLCLSVQPIACVLLYIGKQHPISSLSGIRIVIATQASIGKIQISGKQWRERIFNCQSVSRAAMTKVGVVVYICKTENFWFQMYRYSVKRK